MITDYLIIGSGIAGLSLALKLSKLGKVIIITKKKKAESNTNYAQGGMASVLGDDDNFELHINDTLSCGGDICKYDAVKKIVTDAPRCINELIELGVKFTKEHGRLALGREGGHSRNRIVHAKDLTGKEIETALIHDVSVNKNITVLEYWYAIDLLTKRNIKPSLQSRYKNKNVCYGTYALNAKTKKIEKIIAKKTILATGGLGQVYLHSSNPSIATGDGYAMGYRAGCELGNMEFVQFHPTTLYEKDYSDSEQVFLISEAVRGAGAVLKTRDGKEFMQNYDKRKSLAPRDIVARAIDSEMKKRGDDFVYLDATLIGADDIKKKFPHIYRTCLKKGLDITKEFIPVVPAAHYSCGGVVVDLEGRTNVKNLYACGEVSMTGLHGANRLASNSLLEAVVYANAIFESINRTNESEFQDRYLRDLEKSVLDWDDKGTANPEEWILISHNRKEIKEVMSDYVGIVRSTYRLERAQRRIKMMKDEIKEFYKRTKVSEEILEMRNLAFTAFIIIESAMKRKESRGLHYMLDYPERDDINFKKDTIIRKFKS